jgi:hypothetical protein
MSHTPTPLQDVFNAALALEQLRSEARAALRRFDSPAYGSDVINGAKIVCKGHRRAGKDVFVWYVNGGRKTYRAALAKVKP